MMDSVEYSESSARPNTSKRFLKCGDCTSEGARDLRARGGPKIEGRGSRMRTHL